MKTHHLVLALLFSLSFTAYSQPGDPLAANKEGLMGSDQQLSQLDKNAINNQFAIESVSNTTLIEGEETTNSSLNTIARRKYVTLDKIEYNHTKDDILISLYQEEYNSHRWEDSLVH